VFHLYFVHYFYELLKSGLVSETSRLPFFHTHPVVFWVDMLAAL